MKHGSKNGRDQARNLRKEMPEAARLLWMELKAKRLDGFKFRREHPIGPYIVDFACVKQKFIIEVDGDSHYIGNAPQRDVKRTDYLNDKGWTVHRILNDDIYKHLDDIMSEIHEIFLRRSGVNPVPARGKEAIDVRTS